MQNHFRSGLSTLMILAGAALCSCGRGGSNELARFGSDQPMAGGYAIAVSDDFGPDQARQLYDRITSDAFRTALAKYACGDPVPQMTYQLVLYKRSESASRRVQVGYSVYLDPGGRQRGLVFGLNYLIKKYAGQIDPTKSWSHTYQKPTGETFQVAGDYVNNEPICDATKRESGQEWITWGPDERP